MTDWRLTRDKIREAILPGVIDGRALDTAETIAFAAQKKLVEYLLPYVVGFQWTSWPSHYPVLKIDEEIWQALCHELGVKNA